IRLPAGTYLVSRTGSGEDQAATGDLDITSSVSITGDGAATTIVDGQALDRVFDVRATGAAVISGVTIQNGSADAGAGIRVEGGTLKLMESTVIGNQASDAGGGIDNDVGVLEVVRSTVSGTSRTAPAAASRTQAPRSCAMPPSAATPRTTSAADSPTPE